MHIHAIGKADETIGMILHIGVPHAVVEPGIHLGDGCGNQLQGLVDQMHAQIEELAAATPFFAAPAARWPRLQPGRFYQEG